MGSGMHPPAPTIPNIRQEIHPDVSHPGIARLLKRENMSRLAKVLPKAAGATIANTTKYINNFTLHAEMMQ